MTRCTFATSLAALHCAMCGIAIATQSSSASSAGRRCFGTPRQSRRGTELQRCACSNLAVGGVVAGAHAERDPPGGFR